MKSKIEITGIIPVKAKSERVKNKNLRKFADTNLYELKINQSIITDQRIKLKLITFFTFYLITI